MSRDLATTGRYGTTTTVPVSTTGSLAFWFNPHWSTSTNDLNKILLNCQNDSSNYFRIQYFTDEKWYIGWTVATISFRDVIVRANLTLNAGTWYHLIVAWNITNTLVYLNGSVCTNESGGGAPAALTLTGTNFIGSSAVPDNYGDGLFAEIALYSVSLDSTQRSNLAAGYRPSAVGTPVLYLPMLGIASPEPAQVGVQLTLTGSPAAGATHPPILGLGGPRSKMSGGIQTLGSGVAA